MNCQQCRDLMNAFLERLLEPGERDRVESHLADCADCREEFDAGKRLMDLLTRSGQVAGDAALEILVMDRIIREQAIQLRRFEMERRRRWIPVGGAAAVVLVLLTIASLWPTRPDGAVSAAESRLNAAEAMAKGAEATPETETIHIRARMRTRPGDNFGLIKPEFDFVPIEFWMDYRDSGKWRIEKPKRVVVMDGTSTLMLIGGRTAVRLPMPTKGAFDTDWFHRIAAVKSNLTDDLRSALAAKGKLKLVEKAARQDELTVVVDVKSKLKDGDYVKNKFIMDSDNRRTYHFDRETGRLEGLEIHLRGKDSDLLIFEITEIKYNQPIDPKVFTLDLPDDVVFFQEPKVLPDNEKYARMTPQEAARAFFEACGREDWEEYMNFSTMTPDDRIKRYLGGLEIVRLGEPFQSGGYGGWFVPYEIKLKSGHVKKHNLALRKDNPAKRFIMDGGL